MHTLSGQVGGDHYRKHKIQPIQYILENKLGFTEGSIVKYITRFRDKGGAVDLKKVIQNTLVLLEYEYGITADLVFSDEKLSAPVEENPQTDLEKLIAASKRC